VGKKEGKKKGKEDWRGGGGGHIKLKTFFKTKNFSVKMYDKI
jgi:hypothetical protein